VPADGIRIEADKCYALVELTLSQPINPEVKEQKPTARELLGESSKKEERELSYPDWQNRSGRA
jgi:hypothetical protein